MYKQSKSYDDECCSNSIFYSNIQFKHIKIQKYNSLCMHRGCQYWLGFAV